ncbi:carboxymuconolactone decarboxylase family protein [Cryobacterium sp. PH31-L1]|uniref:carboxymuconolactone decarboxylase family protein n=1 Tax=Cryobacterium sp. PH31-L1 TaxID=3046199 RepID=UPI0024B9565A|nr:carboxymuconolactone decarboxylase family protein [Cryobacterium sp. PH31-L1]MDJ0377306.1 carboxymuconolactone decarboxylase family protein [Cryobacterium sp. PH31-L1]
MSESGLSESAQGGRLPLLSPTDLDPAQQRLYDEIVAPPRGDGPFLVVDNDGLLAGPFNALLYSPALGQAVSALGASLRFAGTLENRTRELVVCLIAAEYCCEYEWYAHSRVAATVGITPLELRALAQGVTPETATKGEASALAFALALVRDRAVDAGTHARAKQQHGHAGLVEITILAGYYQLLAGLLIAFDVPAPAPAPASVTEVSS